MKNFPFWLSTRLTGKNNGTGRTGSVIAVLGVAFAIAVMEITLSVSSGFKDEIVEKLQGFVAPITILPSNETSSETSGLVSCDSALYDEINSVVPNSEKVPVYRLQGLLKSDSDFVAMTFKAYGHDFEATFEKNNLISGQWIDDEDKKSLVVSDLVARDLNLEVGDRIYLCYLVENTMKSRPLIVSGVYDSGFAEFDKGIAYINGRLARDIFHADTLEFNQLELRNINLDEVDAVSSQLRNVFFQSAVERGDLQDICEISTIEQQGAVFLNWLKLLDTNVIVIFILMAAVAICTLISSLFIQVLEKMNTIGLLRALGMRNSSVSNIFIHLTVKLIGWGIILGNLLGLGLLYLQDKYHFVSLDPEMYYLKFVPVKIDVSAFILLNISVIIAGWLIIILPARLATRIAPASTLRFD